MDYFCQGTGRLVSPYSNSESLTERFDFFVVVVASYCITLLCVDTMLMKEGQGMIPDPSGSLWLSHTQFRASSL